MSIRSGIMSQSRPPGRIAPPGQTSSGTSGISGSLLRTPGPTAASAARIAPKTTTVASSTVGNAQSETANKLLQSQAQTIQQQQQQQQQQTQQQAQVQCSPSAAQQSPQKQEQQQRQALKAPKTQSNSTPAISQPTPTKPPTAQAQQLLSTAFAGPSAEPGTQAPEPPHLQPVQPVQPTPNRPPLPTVTLVLDPQSELVFQGSFKHTITTCMRLTNPSSDTTICYKLRTTAPHLYCARPSVDVIGPNQTADIKVILQAASVDLADVNVRHKLMVQWISVPEGQIISLDKLWQQSRPQDVSNAKLSCVLERNQERTVENCSLVENGIEPVINQATYSTINSQPKTEVKSLSTTSSSSSSSGFLLVILVVAAAVIAALVYNNRQ